MTLSKISGLPKTFSYQNLPKLILGEFIKFQKGLMKNKKIAGQKIGVFYWTLPLPELSRFKKGNGFFSSICWLAGLCL